MTNQEKNNWEGRELSADFTSIFPDGRAIGIFEDQTVIALGVLPGETATVRVAKHKKGKLIADVLAVTSTNATRLKPRENHYLSCSPWQIMPYEEQINIKRDFIQNRFAEFGNQVFEDITIVPSEQQWGYRTKIEFGVQQIGEGWSLTLHGNSSNIPTPTGCLLASNSMNAAALSTLRILQANNVDIQHIKSIVVRESKTTNQLLVAVYVFPAEIPSITTLPTHARALVIMQTDSEKLISSPKKILQIIGSPFIEEQLCDLTISYPSHAFFQNNIPLYQRVLGDIAAALPKTRNLIDMYAGVGTIGLTLHKKAKKMIAYEVSEHMTRAANENARRNDITNYEAVAVSDLTLSPAHLQNADAVVVNPTRRGLNEKVISALLQTKPEHIAYLSCNHQTQARDFAALQNMYTPIFFQAYDFYPNTAHVETLLILKLIRIPSNQNT